MGQPSARCSRKHSRDEKTMLMGHTALWECLSAPWRACMEEAWTAYCAGSVPIGAVITDAVGQVIAHGRNCIFEDHAGRAIEVSMAHEMGHHLGRDDHYIAARKKDLMYGYTDQRGINLTKDDVNGMNP